MDLLQNINDAIGQITHRDTERNILSNQEEREKEVKKKKGKKEREERTFRGLGDMSSLEADGNTVSTKLAAVVVFGDANCFVSRDSNTCCTPRTIQTRATYHYPPAYLLSIPRQQRL